MKKIKFFLPALMFILAAISAVAFKPAATITQTESWYVLDLNGDPQDPNDYTLDPEFNEETMCQGSRDVCAIRAEGSTHPDFNYGDLNTDSDVKQINYKGE
jgi:hypothetical protein